MARLSSRPYARAIAATLLALSGSLATASVQAQTAPALTLRWTAPPRCPQQREVQDRVRALTGSASSGAALQAEGTLTKTDAGGFHLKLVMRSARLADERHFDDKSCENLAGAAAVTLALLMRSEQPSSEREPGAKQAADSAEETAKPAGSTVGETSTQKQTEQPAPTDSTSPAQSPVSTAALAMRAAAPPAPRRWRLLARAPFAALAFGPLPKPSLGVGLGFGVSNQSWRFVLEATAWHGQSMSVNAFPQYGADVARASAKLATCRALRLSAFEVAPCLTLALEHVSARGTGPDLTPQSQQASWLGVGAGAQGRLYLAAWFDLWLAVDAQAETARPRISIDGVGDVGELGAAAFAATIGPEWIL